MSFKYQLSVVALAVVFGSNVACSVIPKDGPASDEVRSGADVRVPAAAEPLSYALVSLSSQTLAISNRFTAASGPSFARLAGRRSGSQARIAVGDVLALTVFEATAGGLFLPDDAGTRSGNFVQIPNQQVDGSGSITAPYAGTIQVVGLTPQQVGKAIAAKLAKRAIEPQVVVSLVERRGNDVSVLGDVNLPTRFSLDPGGIRLLGAIARSGGPKSPPYETVVTLQRKGRTDQAVMTNIVKSPDQNVELEAGDVIYVSRESRVFLALGATPSPGSVGGINNRRFTFDNDNMSLSEAVAKAGGLDDNRADPRAVFLYRLESKRALAEMGVDTAIYEGDLVPTIYTVDLGRSDGLFLSNSFFMRNKDLIYVSNSLTTDFNKFFGSVRNVTGSFYDVSLGSTPLR